MDAGASRKSLPSRPSAHVDGILLLAEVEPPQLTAMLGQPITYMSASNYFVFANLVRAWPDVKLAFSGGSGALLFKSGVKSTNSDVARQLLNTLGISTERLVFEDSSRTTHENAVMSAALIHPAKRPGSWSQALIICRATSPASGRPVGISIRHPPAT